MRTLFLWLCLAAVACARVGGGQSYSGGGGGGGGDDAGLIYFLFRIVLELCFRYPVVGIPLLLCLIGGCIWYYNQQSVQVREWSSSVTPYRAASTPVRGLQEVDPNFSRPLFLDFITLLYARAQTEKVSGLKNLAAYLSLKTRDQLENEARVRGVTRVDEVIVGSIRLVSVQGLNEEWTSLAVALETNFTEHVGDKRVPLYSVETWYLTRKTGVLSKGPEEITKFACPSCGNPGELNPDGTCPFCDRLVTDGSYAWTVRSIQLQNRTERPPMVVGGSGEEIGTELPTRFQEGLPIKIKEFQTRHPEFSWQTFEQRARHIFVELQQAWTTQQWERARPYETDSLFNTHRYWIETYKVEGLVNRLEDIELNQVVAVRIETDAYFDAITVRMFATMKDYTVNREGTVVQGSATTPRRFTEYWTFIRRIGAQQKRNEENPGVCPSCGAPLDNVNMAGVCEYCGSKITSGDFDWVLTQIEQDEAYAA